MKSFYESYHFFEFFYLICIIPTLQRTKQLRLTTCASAQAVASLTIYNTKHMMKFLIFISFFMTLLSAAAQSPIRLWDKRFAGDSTDNLNAIKRASNGSLFLAGKSNSKNSGEKSLTSKGGYDYWVVKTDSNGTKLWDATIGTTSNEDLYSVVPTADGGCLVGGFTNGGKTGDKNQASFGSSDFWIVKLNASGVKQWDSAYGGNSYEELHYIEPTTDKGYLLIGLSYSAKSGNKKSPNKGDADIWVVKIDSVGRMLWDSSYGGKGYDNCWEGHQTKDGGYMLAAWSKSPISGNKTKDTIGNSDLWLVKINANGVFQWDKVYGGTNLEEINTFMELKDGGFLFPTYSNSGKSGNKLSENKAYLDIWLIRTDANGNKLWEREIGGNSDERCFAIAQTIDNGYVMGGYSYSSTGDRSKFNYGGLDYWVIKIDSGGRPIWDEHLGGKKDDYMQDMVLTPGDNIVLAGYSKSGKEYDRTVDTLNGAYDYWIAKVKQPNFYITKHDTLMCPNDMDYVSYATTNTFADTNKIFLQLSDGYSNFTYLTNVGFKIGTKLKVDSVLALIPGNAYAAPYYKYRFISTGPKDTSLWSFSVKILALPKKPVITHYLDTIICSNSNGVTYQWLKNNVPISGATQRKYRPTVPAYYSVRVDSVESCPAMSDPLAINNIGIRSKGAALEINALPNPFVNSITISLANLNAGKMEIDIFSIDGKLIYHETLTEQTTVIPAQYFVSGIYIVKVVGTEGIGTVKMIKE